MTKIDYKTPLTDPEDDPRLKMSAKHEKLISKRTFWKYNDLHSYHNSRLNPQGIRPEPDIVRKALQETFKDFLLGYGYFLDIPFEFVKSDKVVGSIGIKGIIKSPKDVTFSIEDVADTYLQAELDFKDGKHAFENIDKILTLAAVPGMRGCGHASQRGGYNMIKISEFYAHYRGDFKLRENYVIYHVKPDHCLVFGLMKFKELFM